MSSDPWTILGVTQATWNSGTFVPTPQQWDQLFVAKADEAELSSYATVASLSGYAPLASPAMSGVPTVPTAVAGTNTVQAASTGFVATAIAPLATTAYVNATFVTPSQVAAAYLPLTGGALSGALTVNASETVTGALTVGGVLQSGPAQTAAPYSHIVDAFGNMGLGTPIPAGNQPATANGGTIFCATLNAVNQTSNSYYDGTNPRFVAAGYAGSLTWPSAAVNKFSWLVSSASGAAGAVTAWNQLMTLDNLAHLTLSAPAAANPELILNKIASGQTNSIITMTNNSLRWQMALGDATAESGGNVGSAFVLYDYNDSGASGVQLCSALRTNNVMTFTNPIVNGSDARLKTDVEPIRHALATVLRLRGVSFQRRGRSKDGREIGFLAQEVAVVSPESVQASGIALKDAGGEGDEMMLGLDYGGMAALFAEAIKTLARTIEAQEARIGSLEAALAGGMA